MVAMSEGGISVTSHKSLVTGRSRIVISSASEKSLSFAAQRSMFGNPKRETRYPPTFVHRPIHLRQSRHLHFSFLIQAELSSDFRFQTSDG